jgi:CBS-domain-containing membrane protein
MKIEELMTREVRSCFPDDGLDAAAYAMWEVDCGYLPVLAQDGSGRLIGAVTDRDICMAALFEGKPLREIRVRQAMARDVQSCSPADGPRQVLAAMRAAQVRRLPVVDRAGRLVGIVSLADLARIAGRRSGRATPVTKSALAETLAAITVHRNEERRREGRVRPHPRDTMTPTHPLP